MFTIQKARTLINRVLADDALHKLSCFIIDELHMVRKAWESPVGTGCQ